MKIPASKESLKFLTYLRQETPDTRADCLTDQSVGCQCLSFSCQHNITGTIAYDDPLQALMQIINSATLPVPVNELGRNPNHLRRNCTLDYTHDNETYKPEEIAEILGTYNGKIKEIEHKALRKLSK
jgi:hypothetical protein